MGNDTKSQKIDWWNARVAVYNPSFKIMLLHKQYGMLFYKLLYPSLFVLILLVIGGFIIC
jgi:hypothetical protein